MNSRIASAACTLAPIGIVIGWLGMRLRQEVGDEPLWTLSHLFWLPAYVLLAVAFVALHGLVRAASPGGRALSRTGLALLLAGAGAVTVQMVIDLVVGFTTAGRDEMGEAFDAITAVPLVEPAVYSVGPSLLFVGMLLLAVQAAALRRVSALTGALVTLAVVVAGLDQALGLPMRAGMLAASVLLWIALRPVAAHRREQDAAPVGAGA